jgi:hypothetical protein
MGERNMIRATGCLRTVVSVSTGLLLGTLAGVVFGSLLGVGLALILGVI